MEQQSIGMGMWDGKKYNPDAGIFKPVDYSSIGIQLKDGSLIADLLSSVEF